MRMMTACKPAIGALLLWLAIQPATAHPAHELLVQRKTAELEAQPYRAELYLQRGELHRDHEEFDEAAADYRRARELDPALPGLALAEAALHLDLDDAAGAIAKLDAVLAADPRNLDALTLRGRALSAAGRHDEAAVDLGRGIEAGLGMAPLSPEMYLRHARALTASTPPRPDAALETLERGLAELGRPISLELAALRVEIEAKRIDAALQRVDRLAAGANRPAGWLERRGEILESAGRPGEAQAAYTAVLEAHRALPATKQGSAAVRERENRVRLSLRRLQSLQPTHSENPR
ncbi:hypothetical protein ABI59_10045 [Acidobacteria bacterium Mor1]|nr:hypothetical protein ABI59_10045 [Acidobacteria bacterium Mor1]